MESITRPSINRLARRAGVKSVSDDCFDVIKNIMSEKLI
jgi:histone H3/H4